MALKAKPNFYLSGSGIIIAIPTVGLLITPKQHRLTNVIYLILEIARQLETIKKTDTEHPVHITGNP